MFEEILNCCLSAYLADNLSDFGSDRPVNRVLLVVVENLSKDLGALVIK
jgi:hypothetical protein